jgi:uncharacterized membrane protein YfcA
MPPSWAYILIGLGIGFLVGLTGVGGGSLMTPILVFTGMGSALAVGTDLVYSAVTRSVAAAIHFRQGTVQMEAVRRLAFGSVPAALVTTILVGYALKSSKTFTQGFITHALAGVLIFVAVALLFRPYLEKHVGKLGNRDQRTWTIGIGALVGVLVALTSVGGGSLTIVALIVLYGMSTSEMIGTDVFHAALLSIVAAGAHALISTVNFSVAGYLILGSVPGVAIGSRLTVRLPDQILRFGLAGTLGFVGLRLLFFT